MFAGRWVLGVQPGVVLIRVDYEINERNTGSGLHRAESSALKIALLVKGEDVKNKIVAANEAAAILLNRSAADIGGLAGLPREISSDDMYLRLARATAVLPRTG